MGFNPRNNTLLPFIYLLVVVTGRRFREFMNSFGNIVKAYFVIFFFCFKYD